MAAGKRVAGGRPLILTLTHFHPEHGFGSQAFKGVARIHYNRAQLDELRAKGEAYLGMFKTFGPGVAAALEGTVLVEPDDVYDEASTMIDLGGRRVELRTSGLAHTAGDQVVWLPEERILFTGDLAEERIIPIFPWFRRRTPQSMRPAGRTSSPKWRHGNPPSWCRGMATSAASRSLTRCGITFSTWEIAWRGTQSRQRCGCDCRGTRAKNPRRTSRLVGAGMDRFRDPVLRYAELNVSGLI